MGGLLIAAGEVAPAVCVAQRVNPDIRHAAELMAFAGAQLAVRFPEDVGMNGGVLPERDAPAVGLAHRAEAPAEFVVGDELRRAIVVRHIRAADDVVLR